MKKSKVIKHLKGDIKTFKHESKEDRELIKALKHDRGESRKHEKNESMMHEMREMKRRAKPTIKEKKMKKVMDEFKMGELHSGSKKGPVVKKRKQAVAIGLSEARRAKARSAKRK